ncbi:hypothetical protein Glove_470g10 [Diversispora epigaea]|uniref:Uncharacterized protein n=1 Tax=Diversispora epigaea TaxID=1348612 RepID=A0A397GL46_9GLOM|nr:hypothetical protein Glove_470g10 [Diversispora epigaea]
MNNNNNLNNNMNSSNSNNKLTSRQRNIRRKRITQQKQQEQQQEQQQQEWQQHIFINYLNYTNYHFNYVNYKIITSHRIQGACNEASLQEKSYYEKYLWKSQSLEPTDKISTRPRTNYIYHLEKFYNLLKMKWDILLEDGSFEIDNKLHIKSSDMINLAQGKYRSTQLESFTYPKSAHCLVNPGCIKI